MNQLQTDEKFMRLALNEAQKALKEQEVPIGAVVVAGDAVIGRGHNLVETLADPTAHAEMQALTAAAATLSVRRQISHPGVFLALDASSRTARRHAA